MSRGDDLGDRLFGLLLRLYPAEFRHRFEREMLELLAERRAMQVDPATVLRKE